MSWPSVCSRVHESLAQERLPCDLVFVDLQVAQRYKDALVEAIFLARSGLSDCLNQLFLMKEVQLHDQVRHVFSRVYS